MVTAVLHVFFSRVCRAIFFALCAVNFTAGILLHEASDMPNKCCVPACSSNYKTGKKVQVFSFPKDEVLRKKWLSAIPRKDFFPTENNKVRANWMSPLHHTDGEIILIVTVREVLVQCLDAFRGSLTLCDCHWYAGMRIAFHRVMPSEQVVLHGSYDRKSARGLTESTTPAFRISAHTVPRMSFVLVEG